MAPTTRRPKRVTPKSAGEWGAVVPQWLGIFGLVVQFLIWFATYLATGKGVVEPAFLTAFGGLIVVGQGAEALASLRAPRDGRGENGGDA